MRPGPHGWAPPSGLRPRPVTSARAGAGGCSRLSVLRARPENGRPRSSPRPCRARPGGAPAPPPLPRLRLPRAGPPGYSRRSPRPFRGPLGAVWWVRSRVSVFRVRLVGGRSRSSPRPYGAPLVGCVVPPGPRERNNAPHRSTLKGREERREQPPTAVSRAPAVGPRQGRGERREQPSTAMSRAPGEEPRQGRGERRGQPSTAVSRAPGGGPRQGARGTARATLHDSGPSTGRKAPERGAGNCASTPAHPHPATNRPGTARTAGPGTGPQTTRTTR